MMDISTQFDWCNPFFNRPLRCLHCWCMENARVTLVAPHPGVWSSGPRLKASPNVTFLKAGLSFFFLLPSRYGLVFNQLGCQKGEQLPFLVGLGHSMDIVEAGPGVGTVVSWLVEADRSGRGSWQSVTPVQPVHLEFKASPKLIRSCFAHRSWPPMAKWMAASRASLCGGCFEVTYHVSYTLYPWLATILLRRIPVVRRSIHFKIF